MRDLYLTLAGRRGRIRLLLAFLGWRRGEARRLGVLACVPNSADAAAARHPVRWELGRRADLGEGHDRPTHLCEPLTRTGTLSAPFVHLTALLFVLRRPSAEPVLVRLEGASAGWFLPVP